MDEYTGEIRPCYFPTGAVAENNVPCSGDRYTSCCGYQDICLSNGLCLATQLQPYVISRGGCTNQNWDQGCPEYCREATPHIGSSIINYSFSRGSNGGRSVSRYCCGTVGADNGSTVCMDGQDPFTIDDGYPLPGVGLLANSTLLDLSESANSTNTTEHEAECHDTAIGAGVGVPLGVIALASIAWALWERRKGKKAVAAAIASAESAREAKPPGTYDNGAYSTNSKPQTMSELGASRPVAELNA